MVGPPRMPLERQLNLIIGNASKTPKNGYKSVYNTKSMIVNNNFINKTDERPRKETKRKPMKLFDRER